MKDKQETVSENKLEIFLTALGLEDSQEISQWSKPKIKSFAKFVVAMGFPSVPQETTLKKMNRIS